MSETNLVPVVVNNQPPTLADEQFSGIVDTLMDNAFSGFGAGLRILKPGKMSFKLIENRQEVDIPNGQVFGCGALQLRFVVCQTVCPRPGTVSP